MSEVRLVVFEGLDRSGKSTLRKEFGRVTGERYVSLARFLLSNAAYDIVFGRSTGPGIGAYLRAIEHMERECGMLTVFVDTPPEVCRERDLDGYTVDQLRHHRRVFVSLIGDTSAFVSRLILPTLTSWFAGAEGTGMMTSSMRTTEDLAKEVVSWVESR